MTTTNSDTKWKINSLNNIFTDGDKGPVRMAYCPECKYGQAIHVNYNAEHCHSCGKIWRVDSEMNKEVESLWPDFTKILHERIPDRKASNAVRAAIQELHEVMSKAAIGDKIHVEDGALGFDIEVTEEMTRAFNGTNKEEKNEEEDFYPF